MTGRGSVGLVSDSRSTVFDPNDIRVSVASSGTAAYGQHGDGRGNGGVGERNDGLTSRSTVSEDDINLSAKSQVTHKLAGRMCFGGIPVPGTGHTAYVFEVSTSQGGRWKVTRRYSDFLELNNKLLQIFGKPTRPFPPLPKKVLVGSSSDTVVHERQNKLTAYLQAVLDNKILSSTMEVRRFVEMPGDREAYDEPLSVFRTNIPRPTGRP